MSAKVSLLELSVTVRHDIDFDPYLSCQNQGFAKGCKFGFGEIEPPEDNTLCSFYDSESGQCVNRIAKRDALDKLKRQASAAIKEIDEEMEG